MINATNMKNTTANDLQIGSTFTKDGFSHRVIKITNDSYVNGNESLMIECESESKIYGKDKTTYHFKPTTKIKSTSPKGA